MIAKSLFYFIQVFRSRLEAISGHQITHLGPTFLVEFAAEFIKLEISNIPTRWRVTYMSHPAVSVEQICGGMCG